LPVASGLSLPASPRTRVVNTAVSPLVTIVVSMMSKEAWTASAGGDLTE